MHFLFFCNTVFPIYPENQDAKISLFPKPRNKIKPQINFSYIPVYLYTEDCFTITEGCFKSRVPSIIV